MAGCETRTDRQGGSVEWSPTEPKRSGAEHTGPDRTERAAVMELQVIRVLLLLLSLTQRCSPIETGKTGPEPGEESDRGGRKTIIIDYYYFVYCKKNNCLATSNSWVILKSAFIKYITKCALKLCRSSTASSQWRSGPL